MSKLIETICLARKIKSEQGIGFFTQFSEIIYLYVCRGLGPLLYFEASLWRRDISLSAKKRFMNASQYNARIDQLNPKEYRKFAQHKLAEKSLLTLMGFPTATFIGFYHEGGGSDSNGEALNNLTCLENLLISCRSSVVCFKMAEGWGGMGFVAAKLIQKPSQLKLENLAGNGPSLPFVDFFYKYLQENTCAGLLIEEYIYQHEVLANLHPSSLNTLRIWVIQRGAGAEVLGAVLKIGRDNQVIDNSIQGGLTANVCLSTGELEDLMDTGVNRTCYQVHPNTNCLIKGVRLPHWEACLDLSKRVLMAFPGIKFVGLDMAIGPNGPVIVELNPEPDRKSARNFGEPLADLLRD